MASTRIPIPANTWVQITTADKSGSIHHTRGNGTVIYLEAGTIPTDAYSETTPSMQSTMSGENFPYFGVASNEFVFAYAIGQDVELTVSPVGV